MRQLEGEQGEEQTDVSSSWSLSSKPVPGSNDGFLIRGPLQAEASLALTERASLARTPASRWNAQLPFFENGRVK